MWRVLLTPGCWFQLYPYSKVWDAHLNALMKAHKFEQGSDCIAMLGGNQIWIANHPYASFRTVNGAIVRPSRRTILKAWDKLVKDTHCATRTDSATACEASCND